MKNEKWKVENHARRGGQTLIGVLVSVAIVIALAGFYLSAKGKNPDGSTSSKTALRRSIDLAQEVALQSNLGQIQQIIAMYKGDNEGKVPASFEELKSYAKFPAEMFVNPVDKKPLGYNPQTGQMIVTPYEGMSPAIQKMTANPLQGAADTGSTPVQSTPGTPGAPAMPNIPTIPNSGAAPNMDDM